jgi:hypothetical protein
LPNLKISTQNRNPILPPSRNRVSKSQGHAAPLESNLRAKFWPDDRKIKVECQGRDFRRLGPI